MNGQTQKMTGNLPVAPGKAVAWFAGVSAAVFAFLAAVMMLFVDSENPTGSLAVSLVMALVAGAITLGVMYSQMKPVAQATRAAQYLKQDQSEIRVRQDDYIRTVETRTPVKREEPGKASGGKK